MKVRVWPPFASLLALGVVCAIHHIHAQFGNQTASAQETKVASSGILVVHAKAKRTGQPLQGVSVRCQGREDGKPLRGLVETDEGGVAAIGWQPGSEISSLSITARKENFVPIYIHWHNRRHPIRLPTEKELAFEVGHPLSGVIRNEQGEPIANAEVNILAPATEYEGSNLVFQLADLRTDAEGRLAHQRSTERYSRAISSNSTSRLPAEPR